mmetsp:Transcript_174463/g.559273  ORF Transcript_174463/g.559273 Transcript_174463/m.559273 type:complete len:381 (+) Transcript_174463:45-1187(+)
MPRLPHGCDCTDVPPSLAPSAGAAERRRHGELARAPLGRPGARRRCEPSCARALQVVAAACCSLVLASQALSGYQAAFGIASPGRVLRGRAGIGPRPLAPPRIVMAAGASSSVGASERNETLTSASDRIAQIQAAIRRGEERAARRAAGEAVAEVAPPRISEEVEKMLERMMISPQELASAADGSLDVGAEAKEDPVAARMHKTLEFCPDGKLAQEILMELIDEGATPRAGAFDAVIEAFSRRGALDDALVVFGKMKELEVSPTDVTWDALARPAARGGQFQFVERLYRGKASDRGGDIGPTSLALLLDAYANGLPRQAGRAEAAFRSAMASVEEFNEPPEQIAKPCVLKALRRAVGESVFGDLCHEYGVAFPLDTDFAL